VRVGDAWYGFTHQVSRFLWALATMGVPLEAALVSALGRRASTTAARFQATRFCLFPKKSPEETRDPYSLRSGPNPGFSFLVFRQSPHPLPTSFPHQPPLPISLWGAGPRV
jgi:hypothetical protein